MSSNYRLLKHLLSFVIFCIGHIVLAQKDSVLADPKVYTFVEQAPEFPGGDAALIRFLQQNVVYPQIERDNDIQGKVLVRFVVMEDGRVDSVKVVSGVSPGLDKEAIRVVKRLPNFKPGKQQGKAVKVLYNLPIVYKLSSDAVNNATALQKAIMEKADRDIAFGDAIRQYNAGNYKRSLRFLSKSIKKFPNDYLAYEFKADIESKMGNNQESCKDYQTAISKGSKSAAEALNKTCK